MKQLSRRGFLQALGIGAAAAAAPLIVAPERKIWAVGATLIHEAPPVGLVGADGYTPMGSVAVDTVNGWTQFRDSKASRAAFAERMLTEGLLDPEQALKVLTDGFALGA